MKANLFLTLALAGTTSVLTAGAQSVGGGGGTAAGGTSGGAVAGSATTSAAGGATAGGAAVGGPSATGGADRTVPGTTRGGVVTDSTMMSGAQSSTQLRPQAPNANIQVPRNNAQGWPGAGTVPATSSTALGNTGNNNPGAQVGIGAGTSTGLGIGAGTSTGLGIGAGTSTGQGQITPGSQAPNGAWIPARPYGTLGGGTIGRGVLGGGTIVQRSIPLNAPGIAVTNPAGNPVGGAAIGLGGSLSGTEASDRAAQAVTNATGVATNRPRVGVPGPTDRALNERLLNERPSIPNYRRSGSGLNSDGGLTQPGSGTSR